MKMTYGSKIIATIVSMTLMFSGIYYSAYGLTYGTGLPSFAAGTSNTTVKTTQTSNVTKATGTTKATTKAKTTASKTTTKKVVKVWTLEVLKQYNGENGKPAYIAVNGIIYDVTSAWGGGYHHGVQAGQDLTDAFAASPHSAKTLSRLPVIGEMGKAIQ